MKLRWPRFSVYQSGRGSEPVMVVGSFTSLVAVYMRRPPLAVLGGSLPRRQSAQNHVKQRLAPTQSSHQSCRPRERLQRHRASFDWSPSAPAQDEANRIWRAKSIPREIFLVLRSVPSKVEGRVSKDAGSICSKGDLSC